MTASVSSRRMWVVGYALMALAGVAAIAWPAPSVRAATTPTSGLLVYVWASMLAAGGMSAMLGALSDRWLGEYAGLPALAATFGVYSLAAASTGRATSVGAAMVLASIAVLLLARWRDVALVKKEAARYSEQNRR